MPEITVPADRGYTEEHEWVTLLPGAPVPEQPVRIGITAVAADSLGELVYLDLPEVGSTVTASEICGEVESTKTVSELYPPVSGEVVEVNTAAVDDPGLVTGDPYGDGWLLRVRVTGIGELLSAAQYAAKNGVTA